jgi:hypothetical protein
MQPTGVVPTATPRNIQGVVAGGERLPRVPPGEMWMEGTGGRVGLVPRQIAERLRGRTFNSFDDFRSAFWREVVADDELSTQFNQSNRTLMSNGQPPFGPGNQGQYQLHHITPLEHGGSLYDLENIAVVSSRYHANPDTGGIHAVPD